MNRAVALVLIVGLPFLCSACGVVNTMRRTFDTDPLAVGGPVIGDNVFEMRDGRGTDDARSLPLPCQAKDIMQTDPNNFTPADGTPNKDHTQSDGSKHINACTLAMLLLIKQRWATFAADVETTSAFGNTTADIATLGLNIAGGLTAAGTTKVLTAIAAGITGSKSAINEDILYKSSIQDIMLQMQKNQAIVETRIRTRLANASNPYRSMAEAALDLYDYSRAGSWNDALWSLHADVSKKTADCKQQQTNTAQSIAESSTPAPPPDGDANCNTVSPVALAPTAVALAAPAGNSVVVSFKSGETSVSDLVGIVKAVALAAGNTKPIAVQGMASAVGGPATNLRLSDGRAIAVRKSLIDAGIDTNRIVIGPSIQDSSPGAKVTIGP